MLQGIGTCLEKSSHASMCRCMHTYACAFMQIMLQEDAGCTRFHGCFSQLHQLSCACHVAKSIAHTARVV